MRRLCVAAFAVAAVTFSGCSSASNAPASEAGVSGSESVPAAARPILDEYGLGGLEVTEIVDRLDRMALADRPADLMASVRVDELSVTGQDGTEHALPFPDDVFYLSVAPYVSETHECFYHSLTTCKGELGGKQVQVEIVDDTNDTVLVEETVTTFENGFVGFWVPRDIDGTLQVTFDGKTAQTVFATDEDAPTCLTTLRLS